MSCAVRLTIGSIPVVPAICGSGLTSTIAGKSHRLPTEDRCVSFTTKRASTNRMAFEEKNISKPRMANATSRGGAEITSRAKEGSSRESKKDYLHFLYIARGSLSETQYFIHLARRLGYLSTDDAEALHGQTKFTFACLHGLISAVEKEAGKLGKLIATATSLLILGFSNWSSGRWSAGS